MRRILPSNLIQIAFVIFILFFGFVSNAQDIKVGIIGGATISYGSTISISAGNVISFRITNIRTDCDKVKIEDINLTNTTDFILVSDKVPKNVDSPDCHGHNKYIDFTITNISGNCGATTDINIQIKNDPNFVFTFSINGSPEIYVQGGSPWADIQHGDTTTSDGNGTYFGIVDEGNTVTRSYIIFNTGSCPLDISAVSSSNPDFFAYSPFGLLPPTVTLISYTYTIINVRFTAPASAGTQSSVISISNTANTTFTFTVSAEMFDENIPGPGGITSNFKLWLKSTRGIVKSGSTLTDWLDLGTNNKDATTVSGKEPTYLDTATDNINFNPVVKFENDGGGLEQYMYNNNATLSGFYNHDIFVVMIPDATMTSASSRNTIFAGLDSGSAGDMTGIGFGNYSTEFTDETLSYNQDIPGGGSYNGDAEISATYSNAGIINVRNNAASSPTGQEILYNSNVLTTSNVSDVGFTNIVGSEYWIGRNQDVQGSLNGRIAEVFTFAERLSSADRQKVESYLAIKYGITLGSSTEAQKNYVNSFDTAVWDITANSGYNYDVAGIGKDSISDLNQKQSKTLNSVNGVTIGLGGIYASNSANSNEFEDDGDFLVWGNNNGAYSGTNTNTITMASGITTSVTRIDRKWKIVESIEAVGADLETVFVGIPESAFSGFSKTADEEYALIVADNPAFADTDIIDIIPLIINVDPFTGNPILDQNGNQVYKTWYNFHETKYFTFGKLPKLSENHSASIGSGDFLVGEIDMNLNPDAFAVSAWVKSSPSANTRTIMAKGSKLQLRLNSSNQVEVTLDDLVTAKFTSTMTISDGKWHQITFVYKSGTIFIYIDGVLDHSEQDVVPPSPNFNHFSVGAIYDDKNSVTNPFLGEIDEVYIWNQALTEVQVRYLMNQEVERFDISGTDYVTGKIIPQGSLSNEVASIPWSDLEVYYDFNSFYGSTVESLTDSPRFLRLKYLDKDKELLDAQTIPAPYVSIADGDWDDVATWANSSSIVLPNSLGLDGTMIDWNIVDIGHDITSGDRDISLLGLIQTSGTLTIADPIATVPIENNAGQALTITHYLELDGVIDLVGESQLIQTKGSIIDADSGGYIERDQQGTANSFNYNYWSSSVGPITGNTATRGDGATASNANFTIGGILNDGSNSDLYQSLIYNVSPDGGGSVPPPGFARTISSYWLYKFYGAYDNYYAWAKIDEASSLLAGEGYTMKGTSGTVPISTNQNYVFKGLPNNGDITLTLDNSSGEVERLIGNPYPSAMDATEFILDNMSIADGGNNASGTIFNGALYFWDHFGEENTHYLKGYVGGYATRNLTGGAAAISNDSRINNTSNAGSSALGTKVPGQYIPVSQGFFVRTAIEGFNNDNGVPIATVDGGNILFKNSQRVFERENASTSLFFKPSLKKKKTQIVDQNKIPTIRLIYDSPLGYHRQIVVGAINNASNDFDLGYDAFMPDVTEEDMYWMLNNSKFVIQGVNNFNESQEFSLGLKVKKAGLAKIKVEALENIEGNMNLYIKDKLTNETHSIANEPFEMYLDEGTYNDRFALVFYSNDQSELVSIEDNDFLNEIDMYYDSEISSLKIKTLREDSNILRIKVFGLAGQEMKSVTANSKEVMIPMTVIPGIYIVKTTTENGTINKKIIIK